jgi:pimeloyl-ACP methyl ester carboxylesterase
MSRARGEAFVTPAPRAANPAATGLSGGQIFTEDGVRLSVRHDLPERQGQVGVGVGVVVVHGFTGSWRRPELRGVVSTLTRHPGVAGVVSLDLRGHGGSGGRSTVGHLETLDVDAAVRWARELGHRRVVTLGWSMGAAVVIRQAAAARRTVFPGAAFPDAVFPGGVLPDAVVAVSGPSRWHYHGTAAMRLVQVGVGTRLGRAVLARGYGTRLSDEGWPAPGSPDWPAPPDADAVELRGHPLLVVHGDADHYFPLDHPRWLAGAAGAELWIEPGMGHAESAASSGLVRRIADWAELAVTRP